MSTPNESDVSFSAPLDGAEASGSGCAAGVSSGCECEPETYGDVSLSMTSSDSNCPSSKHAKTTSGIKRCKPTGKFKVSWKLPEHIMASKRDNILMPTVSFA